MGKRVNNIARLAQTTYNMATVVANVMETERAVAILKIIVEVVQSNMFKWYMRSYYPYWNEDSKRSFIRNIRGYLHSELPNDMTNINLNISQKFIEEVEKILKK